MKIHQHLFRSSILLTVLTVLFGGGGRIGPSKSSSLFVLGQEEEGEEDDTPLCGDIYYTHRGSSSRDPVAEMGGLQNIDKIISIEVDSAHNLFFCTDNRVIGKIATTYRLNDGSTRRVVYGDGGHCGANLPAINIPEGVYLTKISGFDGGYLDWVQFHMSDGSVFKPYTSSAFPGTNFEYSADKAVIKAVSTLFLFTCVCVCLCLCNVLCRNSNIVD